VAARDRTRPGGLLGVRPKSLNLLQIGHTQRQHGATFRSQGVERLGQAPHPDGQEPGCESVNPLTRLPGSLRASKFLAYWLRRQPTRGDISLSRDVTSGIFWLDHTLCTRSAPCARSWLSVYGSEEAGADTRSASTAQVFDSARVIEGTGQGASASRTRGGFAAAPPVI
jgi:hypothetical protein